MAKKKNGRVRRFEVWVGAGRGAIETKVVTFEPGATEKEIDATCQEYVDTMLGNLDSGWRELSDG